MPASVTATFFARFLSKMLMLLSAAFLLLCLLAGIFLDNLWAWVAGWIYLVYDLLMMLFVLWHSRNLKVQPLSVLSQQKTNHQQTSHQQTIYQAARQPKFQFASTPSAVDFGAKNPVQMQAETVAALPEADVGMMPCLSVHAPLTVTVLIPARNEQLILPQCLQAVLAQDYPIQHICIVDDGSTDHTANLLQRDYGLTTHMGWVQSTSDARLSVLRLQACGKARALNAALAYTQTDLVVTLDADTLLQPQAIRAVVDAFQHHPTWVAAGGVLQPVCLPNANAAWRGQFFEFFQRFEYVMSYLSRAAWAKVNALLLVSGAFGIYRTEALKAINGFDPHSMVEDYEVNHRIYRHAAEQGLNWSVGVVGQAVARTDAPNRFTTFFHQRRRWFGGFLATQWQHLEMMANPAFGRVGRVMLPLKVLDAMQPFLGLMALFFLLRLAVQQQAMLWMLLWVVLFKLLLDLCFYAWALRCYGRWVGQSAGLGAGQMVVATLAAPLSFSVMKLYAALLGWWVFLSNTRSWKAQR